MSSRQQIKAYNTQLKKEIRELRVEFNNAEIDIANKYHKIQEMQNRIDLMEKNLWFNIKFILRNKWKRIKRLF